MRYPGVIDRAVKMVGYAKIFIDGDEVEVNKSAKTNKANIRPSSRNNLGL